MKLTNEQINALSDHEVNVMVTWLVNELDDCWSEHDDGSALFHCGPTGENYYHVKIEDYCNDPAVMWTLICDIKIDIKHRETLGTPCAVKDDIIFADKKLLRSAAIVYLKMKGVL